MSVLLSADDLNDFISPGVACIKPVETLPVEDVRNPPDPYEVTTEDKLPKDPPPPAQISLTDCLACSGCVTSAETVLVSLQSHAEVQSALDSAPSLFSELDGEDRGAGERRVFVASVAPQVRASLAATYGTTIDEAGRLIENLLSGPHGICRGGKYGNSFGMVIDTNAMRDLCLVLGAEEILDWNPPSSQPTSNGLNGTRSDERSLQEYRPSKRPLLSSACPGWICYAEKTHPFVLPHLSAIKSPQALTGTLLKTILSKQLDIAPSQIFHLSIMPCFDKKLEASRQELTNITWRPSDSFPTTTNRDAIETTSARPPVRDVDCVITPRELLMLASSRNISFPSLPRTPVSPSITFADPTISSYMFPHQSLSTRSRKRARLHSPVAGTSGGYLWHTIQTAQARHLGSTIVTNRGRNTDLMTYTLLVPSQESAIPSGGETPPTTSKLLEPNPIFQAARYYGFKNISNLVRKLQPPRPSRLTSYASSYTSRTDRPASKSSRTPLPKPALARTNGVRPVQSPQQTAPSPSDNEKSFDYIEVMACPGGCTNGGGQIRIEDLGELQGADRGLARHGEDSTNGDKQAPVLITQKEWAARVDAKYYDSSTDDGDSLPGDSSSEDVSVDAMDIDDAPATDYEATDTIIDGVNHSLVHRVLDRWAEITGLDVDSLVNTTYRAEESDVGKNKPKGKVAVRKGGGVEAVVGKEGGGW